MPEKTPRLDPRARYLLVAARPKGSTLTLPPLLIPFMTSALPGEVTQYLLLRVGAATLQPGKMQLERILRTLVEGTKGQATEVVAEIVRCFGYLNFSAAREGHPDQWQLWKKPELTSLAPRLQQIAAGSPPEQATNLYHLLMRLHVPGSQARFMDSLEMASRDPRAFADPTGSHVLLIGAPHWDSPAPEDSLAWRMDRLVDLAVDAPSLYVRRFAINALRDIPTSTQQRRLFALMERERDDRSRMSLLQGFAKWVDRADLAPRWKRVFDPGREDRMEIEAEEELMQFLRQRLDVSPPQYVRLPVALLCLDPEPEEH
jgi:hypothetical protein